MEDLYRLLGLMPTATPVEIRDAYGRKRAELIEGAAEAEDGHASELASLDEAYMTLIDPGRRALYDRSLTDATDRNYIVPARDPTTIVAAETPSIPVVQKRCPHCGALNPDKATVCRECGQQMSRPCPHCGSPVSLSDDVCSRCETVLAEYDKRRFTEATVVQQRVREERAASRLRVEALEEVHAEGRREGVVFWAVVIALCITLPLLALFFMNVFGQILQ